MKQRVVRIAPLQAAKVSALIYACISLVIAPILMLPALMGNKDAMPVSVSLLFIPLYVIIAFVGTIAMTWLYNLIAGRIGGIEITVETEPSSGGGVTPGGG